MSKKGKPKIFISHVREDEQIALQLYSDLKDLGSDPWLDKQELLPGQNWKEEIWSAIRMSSHILILISRSLVAKRGYIHKEIRQILDVHLEIPPGVVHIIPVRLDDTEPSHVELRDLQWVDIFPSYKKALESIAKALGLDTGPFFVKTWVRDLGWSFQLADPNDPLRVDGYLGIQNFRIGVRVLSRRLPECQVSHDSKAIIVELSSRDTMAWRSANIPIVAICLVEHQGTRLPFWADTSHAKLQLENPKIKFKLTNLLIENSSPRLAQIASDRTGFPDLPRLRSGPVLESRVRKFKEKCWKFYSGWRAEGSHHREFGKIEVTLSGWRHITRPSNSQLAVCHRLSLLSYAKELIESGSKRRLVREYVVGGQTIRLYTLSGIATPPYRSAAVVVAVIKVFEDHTARFCSVYEKSR